MTVQFYAPAIRDAIRRGDLREMKVLLRQAKKLQREQGDLPGALERLEKAIEKVQRKQTRS